jgi:hypothetical protein
LIYFLSAQDRQDIQPEPEQFWTAENKPTEESYLSAASSYEPQLSGKVEIQESIGTIIVPDHAIDHSLTDQDPLRLSLITQGDGLFTTPLPVEISSSQSPDNYEPGNQELVNQVAAQINNLLGNLQEINNDSETDNDDNRSTENPATQQQLNKEAETNVYHNDDSTPLQINARIPENAVNYLSEIQESRNQFPVNPQQINRESGRNVYRNDESTPLQLTKNQSENQLKLINEIEPNVYQNVQSEIQESRHQFPINQQQLNTARRPNENDLPRLQIIDNPTNYQSGTRFPANEQQLSKEAEPNVYHNDDSTPLQINARIPENAVNYLSEIQESRNQFPVNPQQINKESGRYVYRNDESTPLQLTKNQSENQLKLIKEIKPNVYQNSQSEIQEFPANQQQLNKEAELNVLQNNESSVAVEYANQESRNQFPIKQQQVNITPRPNKNDLTRLQVNTKIIDKPTKYQSGTRSPAIQKQPNKKAVPNVFQNNKPIITVQPGTQESRNQFPINEPNFDYNDESPQSNFNPNFNGEIANVGHDTTFQFGLNEIPYRGPPFSAPIYYAHQNSFASYPTIFRKPQSPRIASWGLHGHDAYPEIILDYNPSAHYF